METKRHTDVGVDRLRPPAEGRHEQGDSVVPGLRLRITHTGNKSWSVIYKIAGDRVDQKNRARSKHRMTLGNFPALSVDDARDAARDALTAASKGFDPAKPEKLLNGSITGKELLEDYVQREAKPSLKKWREVEQKITKHFVPTFGHRALSSITRSDAKAWIDGIASAGAADEILRLVKRMFNFAVEEEITEVNPFHLVKLPKKFKLRPRERTLSDDELKAIWAAAEEMGNPYGPAYKLLMLTGQRREEISGMRWAWLSDDSVLEIPSESYKTDRIHTVPLPKAVQDILETLPKHNEGDYVFSTRAGTIPINGFSKAKVRLDELSGVSGWVVHDMRRTVRTNMPRLGVNKDVAHKVIGHTDGGVDAVYDRYDYFDEKKAALETWAAHVMKVVK